MPIFDYECPNCGIKENVWAKIHEMELICECGQSMHRICAPPNIICDIEPYLDDVMDPNPVPIYSRQHKAEELKKRGLFIK